MSLLDFDHDEEWDTHLADLNRREFYRRTTITLISFILATCAGLLVGSYLFPAP